VTHIENRVAVSVVKHLNPCGLAVSGSLMNALELAWAGDPVSAYGGIICLTGEVNEEIARWFDKKFVEIIIATGFTSGALGVFAKKKNLRLLVTPVKPVIAGEKTVRSISGGILVQDEDEGGDTVFTNVTSTVFDQRKINLARFGVMACKHLKSNAIALVTENADGSFWLTGAGMGQPNRLDSLRQLTIPRFALKNGLDIKNAVLISDAFFPFHDSVEAANAFGIRFIVQPGGSIRDQEIIDACNESGIAMLFTGRRHFRH
jgi:phosphoribosylaminoimidazolecarboxamide formyltransferase/IMP cyclohydrolase